MCCFVVCVLSWNVFSRSARAFAFSFSFSFSFLFFPHQNEDAHSTTCALTCLFFPCFFLLFFRVRRTQTAPTNGSQTKTFSFGTAARRCRRLGSHPVACARRLSPPSTVRRYRPRIIMCSLIECVLLLRLSPPSTVRRYRARRMCSLIECVLLLRLSPPSTVRRYRTRRTCSLIECVLLLRLSPPSTVRRYRTRRTCSLIECVLL